jgi:hypothetical protein
MTGQADGDCVPCRQCSREAESVASRHCRHGSGTRSPAMQHSRTPSTADTAVARTRRGARRRLSTPAALYGMHLSFRESGSFRPPVDNTAVMVEK